MVDVRVPGEGGVEGQEPLDLLARGAWHLDISHCCTVVQGINREKSRHFLSVLVDIFQEEPIGPHGEPRVYPFSPERPVLWVEFLERLLYALEAVLGHVGDGGAEVEHPAPADGGGALLTLPGGGRLGHPAAPGGTWSPVWAGPWLAVGPHHRPVCHSGVFWPALSHGTHSALSCCRL